MPLRIARSAGPSLERASTLKFDSVVFADRASSAALSCLSRLKAEREAGRKSLLVGLLDIGGAEAIASRGLAEVSRLDEVEGDAGEAPRLWRERLAVIIRRFNPRHVMAPLGLLGTLPALDYFKALRAVSSVDRGRDLLFFEERPHNLMPGATPLRLASLGARLPPAGGSVSLSRFLPFALRLLSGIGTPPIFGGLRERLSLAASARTLFRAAAGWDPQRALGPRVQPVTEPWSEADSADLFALARDLGEEIRLGSRNTLELRMARAAGSLGRSPVERYWLLLPDPTEADPLTDPY